MFITASVSEINAATKMMYSIPELTTDGNNTPSMPIGPATLPLTEAKSALADSFDSAEPNICPIDPCTVFTNNTPTPLIVSYDNCPVVATPTIGADHVLYIFSVCPGITPRYPLPFTDFSSFSWTSSDDSLPSRLYLTLIFLPAFSFVTIGNFPASVSG